MPPKKKKVRRVPHVARPRRGDPEVAGFAEPRLDGFRAGVTVENRRARSLTGRGGGKLAARFPVLAATLGDAVDAEQVTLDCEIIAGNGDVATFALLMDGAGGRCSPLPVTFVAFDMLELDGRAMLRLPVEERKTHLARVVRDTSESWLEDDHARE